MEAGGKDAVLKMLAARPDFMAIVDRDTWSDAECEKLMRTYPGLRILPRFCIENYIICPDELSAVFAEIDGNVIARHIPEGIRHACLWRAAQPLYDALMRAGFHRALMAYPPPSDTQLDGMIKSWQSILSASSVAQQMQEALNSANTQQPEVLLRTFVHGKVFWRGVVEQHMERLFPREDGEELKRRVYRALPVPQDLKDFMQQIFKTPE